MTTETLPETLPVPDQEEINESRGKTSYLPLYRVIMWDDDITTMEFVIRMLIKIFQKDFSSSKKLMMDVHLKGQAHVDTLPLERAEFKVQMVHTAAALEDFPFRCTIEKV